MSTNRNTITDFFNPYDSDHLNAYQHLMEHGAWPRGFVPKGLEFSPTWQAELANKMTGAWVRHCVAERPEALVVAAHHEGRLSQAELAEDLYQALIDAHNRVANHFLTGDAASWSPDFRAVRAEIMSTLYQLRIQADTVRAARRRHLASENSEVAEDLKRLFSEGPLRKI